MTPSPTQPCTCGRGFVSWAGYLDGGTSCKRPSHWSCFGCFAWEAMRVLEVADWPPGGAVIPASWGVIKRLVACMFAGSASRPDPVAGRSVPRTPTRVGWSASGLRSAVDGRGRSAERYARMPTGGRGAADKNDRECRGVCGSVGRWLPVGRSPCSVGPVGEDPRGSPSTQYGPRVLVDPRFLPLMDVGRSVAGTLRVNA